MHSNLSLFLNDFLDKLKFTIISKNLNNLKKRIHLTF